MTDCGVCSAHGKKRTAGNLQEDGNGGYCCAPGFECNTGQGGGKSSGKPMMPGDWTCPGCNDHQFARNQECRKCGTPNPDGGAGGGKGGNNGMMNQMNNMDQIQQNMMNMMYQQGAAAGSGAGAGWAANAMAGWAAAGAGGGCGGCGGGFGAGGDNLICSMHGKKRTHANLIEDGMGGRRCSPGFECRTGNEGSLFGFQKGGCGAGNYQQGDTHQQRAGGAKGMMPGDWNCPGCGDHQFSRNKECRKCSTPNPNPGFDGGKGRYAPY